MASSAGDSETKSYEIAVAQVAGVDRLKFIRKSTRAYVQIDAASYSWRTKGVAWKDDVDLRWDDTFTLLPLSSSAKITFCLFRDSRFKPSKKLVLVGKIEIELGELLEQCVHRPGEDISLSLEVEGKHTCNLTVRVKDPSTTAFTSSINHLPEPSENSTAPRLTAAADAITTTENAVTSAVPSDLLGSFASLMENLSILVKIGDEIAKIHPWVNLAWNVLSVGLKLVQAQNERDAQIAQLIETMRSTYSTVVGSEKLKGDQLLQDVLDLILKQTVICGYFIQDYARRGAFAGKVLKESFSNTDTLISRYRDTFNQLRADFMGRIATQTALVTADVAATVNEIRFDQLLEKLRPSVMDERKRSVCLPNTRLDAIKSTMDWFSDDSDGRQDVMWISGLAGTGKSTLSSTIAGMMDDVGLLGASFFFDRGITERNVSTLIPTLAYQLAHFDTAVGARVQQVVQGTANIASKPLGVQFSKLLSATALGDIPWSRGPILVVIDALDESGSAADQKELIRALSGGFSNLPSFLRILIVSRPERDMLDQFKHTRMRRVELRVDSETSQADITEFIRIRLHEIREANIEYLPALQDWPSEEDIMRLAILAAGLFIWAATACRLIDGQDPKQNMGELIKYQPGAHAKPFASLHQLYKTALQSAGKWDDGVFCSDFRTILGAVIGARVPLSCATIDTLLGLSRPSVQTISRLGSVIRGGKEEPIQLLHTSFFDYLTHPGLKEPWAINAEHANEQIARQCITLLEQELRENLCNLALPHPIQDEKLPECVAYASRFWIEHVCLITYAPDGLGDVILVFMRGHLLHWMEALAIMKSYHVVIRSLVILLKWIQKYVPAGQLYHFVNDAHRFAQYFSNTIEEHPLLIYATALPFTPRDTLIYKTFYHDRLALVVSGVDTTWPPLLQVIHGHKGKVESVGFSPDGLKIVSGSEDTTVRVWDALTGNQLLSPLQGHDFPVRSVGFSSDGLKIVSGSNDNTIRVWDALTGIQLLSPFQGHDDPVTSVGFSPDGLKIVSGSDDETVRVWDALTGKQLLSPLQGHDTVTTVGFSPDGLKIVAGSEDNTIRVWDALTGNQLLSPLQGHDFPVRSVGFSPDGLKIVSGSNDNTIRVWDALTGIQLLSPLRGHANPVRSVGFSADGLKIVSGSEDNTIRVWDTLTGNQNLQLQDHVGPVTSVRCSPDGLKIVSGSDDNTIRVWDALTGKLLSPPQGYNNTITSVGFSPDKLKIVSGSNDNTIQVWDALTGKQLLSSLQGHEYPVRSVGFSPDGLKIVSGSNDNTIRVWDALTGDQLLSPLQGHFDPITSVGFSPDGLKIVSGSDDQTVRVWDALTGNQLLSPLQGHDDTVTTVGFSPDGLKIVSGSEDNTIRVWDALTGNQILSPLQGHDFPVRSVGFSPDGLKIVSGSNDYTIRVWDALTGNQLLSPLEGHVDPVTSAEFFPDGLTIVSASDDQTIRFWDALAGHEHALTGEDFNGKRNNTTMHAHNPAETLVRLGEDGYFVDVNSGRYLSKLPKDFHWDKPQFCESGCIGWREVSSRWVPVIIYPYTGATHV